MAASRHQQPLLNHRTEIGRIKSSRDPKPDGKAFCLKTQNPDNHTHWCFFLLWPLVLFPFGFYYCLLPWTQGKEQYAMSTVLFAIGEIITIMLAIFACGKCPFQKNTETWLYYWIIISIEEGMVYILNGSTKKRWKIKSIIQFQDLRSIGLKSSVQRDSMGCIRDEDAWVILTLSDGCKCTMNKISGAVKPTRLFVQRVDKYLCQAQQQKENEIRQNNRQVIQYLIQNAASAAPKDEVDGDELLHDEGYNISNYGAALQSNHVEMEEVVVENNATLKKCANCGDMMAREHQFCNNCGTKANFNDNKQMKCGGCGGFISKVNKFCPNCGTKINV